MNTNFILRLEAAQPLWKKLQILQHNQLLLHQIISLTQIRYRVQRSQLKASSTNLTGDETKLQKKTAQRITKDFSTKKHLFTDAATTGTSVPLHQTLQKEILSSSEEEAQRRDYYSSSSSDSESSKKTSDTESDSY